MMLLAHNADANATDDTGKSPAHYAASVGCLDLLTVLKDAGADLEQTCRSGDTPASLYKAYSDATVWVRSDA